jgi:hypothetical protein
MVTADAAWQCRQNFTGVIMAGKPAWSSLIKTHEGRSLDRDIAVRETWLNGERRFQA